MDANSLLGLLINWVLAAAVIYIVSRLGLGLTVTSFVSALIAAAIIAVVAWLIGLVLPDSWTQGGGWISALLSLIVSAIVLLVADRFLLGMKGNGFVGALVAAIAIAVLSFIVAWVFGRDSNTSDGALRLLSMFL